MTPDPSLWTDPSGAELEVTHHAEPVPHWRFAPTRGEPIGSFVFVHGLCEHAYRFFRLAKRLAREGVRVHLVHQPGHGDDDTFPDHPLARAYFEHDDPVATLEAIAGFDAAIRARYESRREENLRRQRRLDLEAAVTQARRLVAELAAEGPVVLGGHSLGGLVAILAGGPTSAGGGEPTVAPDGVVALAPGLRPRSSPGGGLVERWAVDALWKIARTPLLAPIHVVVRALAGWGPAINVEWASAVVSDIEAESRLHAEDPLIGDAVPLPYFSQIERAMVEAHRAAPRYPVPVGLFAAADDRVVDTRGAREFMAALPADLPHHTEILEGFVPHDPVRSTRAEETFEAILRFTTSCLHRSPRRSP